MTGLLEHLRAVLPQHAYAAFLGVAEVRHDRILAVPNEFTRSWVCRRFGDELRRWAESTGASAVELVVDRSLGAAPPVEGAPTPREPTPPPERGWPPGVSTRLLAERGFWSIAPGSRRSAFAVEDLRGTLSVEPSRLGVPGTFDAVVFTGLLTLWAGGSRREPAVQTSLHALAGVVRMSWGGRTAAQLRDGIERLKATSFRMTFADEDGGRERLFSLLDEIETRWVGPPSTPHRQVRAVFSRTVWEDISRPRILRPIDLEALRALGHRRELARRLFLFLEAQPGHAFRPGFDLIERVLDQRLAATLGCSGPLWRLAALIRTAGAAICDAAHRYERVELVPRRKRWLPPGEPPHLLHVVRLRRA